MSASLSIDYRITKKDDRNKCRYEHTVNNFKQSMVDEEHDVNDYSQCPCKSRANQYTGLGNGLNLDIGTRDSNAPIHSYQEQMNKGSEHEIIIIIITLIVTSS